MEERNHFKMINKLILFLATFIMGILVISSINIIQAKSLKQNNFIKSDCTGMDLLNSADCLNKELSSWWKYNHSNSKLFWNNGHPIIDWDTIKIQGGVCWHAAEWYADQLDSLGFKIKKEKMYGEGNVPAHEVVLAWDNNVSEYCILDQKAIKCWSLR